MILVLDVGNTSTTVGLYNGEELVHHFRIPSDRDKTVKEFQEELDINLGSVNIEGAIIGSVVEEINDRLCYAIQYLYKIQPVLLSSTSNTGITLSLKNNSEIGADRIANGFRAFELYKDAVIVVDFGTATTFDIVNKNGEFIGGIIAPGLTTQFASLNKSTSKLPKLDVEYIEKAIGNCTYEAIMSGIVRGTACMIDGMLEQCEQELGQKATIIATGGFCKIISKYMKRKFDVVSQNLTIEGLRDLYNINSRAKLF